MRSVAAAALVMVCVGFAISAPGTWALLRVGVRLRMLDSPGAAGHRKAALRAVPNIGGVAITLGIVLPLVAGVAAVAVVDWARITAILPGIAPHEARLRASLPLAVALMAATLALHVVGLIDDRHALPARLKLLGQILPALVLVLFFDVRLLTMLGPLPSILVTMVWIIAITNAMNFLDNMDGLAAGVGVIVSTLFMIAAIVNQQWFIAGILGLMAGSLSGFLLFNLPPARIFMGDGGSLVIGFLLAVLTVRTTWWDPANTEAIGSVWYAIFMPPVILAIPLYDLCSVTLIRLRQGRSPFVGDQQHFSHRLVQRGLSKRGAVAVIWGCTLVTGIGGISLGRLLWWQAVLVGVQTAVVLGVLALLEHATRPSRRSPESTG